ncbi:glycoside hydrolase family 16 protein [Dissoconium aciculare CBS 342.82]|uniref:Glycoside hydrolase family 16 protein n=1 Tax=Dissoconium aciculare CBS 342.82 TaxID=1314786 RepID=A0A6J3MJE8_9PEZI|nr:glycoside hydrolase family 16 protein [Dissoconium aciculare CBS 342.82]KAF1827057.1 glycoside hydrolase family 16 protein [Dissoconium aciculare CBS 342.82]
MTISPISNFAIAGLLSLLGLVSAANCPCGYKLDSPSSGSILLTEAVETDFLHIGNAAKLDLWLPQEYRQTAQAANGPLGRSFDVKNVAANPLRDPHSWAGSSVRGGDPGLQLWVNRTLTPGDSGGSMVHCAEIVMQRGDILYGSFRIGLKTTTVNGTCGAFFFYRDDTSEIDMEFLSKQQLPNNASVNLVIQSPENGGLGYTAPGSPNFAHVALPREPSSGFIEYRFDWLPGRVDFFADNKLVNSMTDNIPTAPGRLHISHWSNGNPGWSAGPPSSDAALTVSYVKAYFNSSDANISAASMKACQLNTATATTCDIPEVDLSSSPAGPDGNGNGQTPFLTNSTDGNLPSLAMQKKACALVVVMHAVVLGTLLVWLF